MGSFLKIGDFLARSAHPVKAGANRPSAFLDHMRTVIVAVRGSDGKEVGQLQ